MSEKTTLLESIKQYGPHTKLEGDRLNCAVVGLSAAFEIPYDTADLYATNQWQRKRRHTTKTSKIVESLSAGKLFNKTVKEAKVVNEYQTPRKLINCRSKLYTFAKKNNKGIYYVLVRKHCTVIKNGEILDSTLGGMTVKKAYRIE
jgi:hypothetical protein